MKRNLITAAVFTALFILLPASLQAQSVKLDVPYYVQGKDSPWADEKLGNKSSVTIRTHGCALTCISMVVSHLYNDGLNPSNMNKWLQRNDGFQDAWEGGDYMGEVSLNWPALAGFREGWVYTRFDWNARPADIVLVKYYLDHGIPVIAEVVYRNAPHYVVITGYDSEGLIMNDPELPEEHRFNNAYNIADEWGEGPSRNIYGIRIFYPNSMN